MKSARLIVKHCLIPLVSMSQTHGKEPKTLQKMPSNYTPISFKVYRSIY